MKKLIVFASLIAVAGWACAFTGTVNVGGHILTAEWSKSSADGKLLEGYRSTGVWTGKDQTWLCLNCVDFSKVYPADPVESGKAVGEDQVAYFFVQLDKRNAAVIWSYMVAPKGKWLVKLPKKEESVASRMEAIEVDCQSRRIRTVESSLYNDYLDRRRTVLTSNDLGEWRKVAPRTLSDNFVERARGRRKQNFPLCFGAALVCCRIT